MITEVELRAGYKEMATEFVREKEALEWSESVITDSYVADEECIA